jgi:hypothetical protein
LGLMVKFALSLQRDRLSKKACKMSLD